MMRVPDPPQDCQDLWRRVCGEFVEMPGLQLTVDQAGRLWAADRLAAEVVLERLVEADFLRRRGPFYVLADSGRRCA